jgi:hypothetical protein
MKHNTMKHNTMKHNILIQPLKDFSLKSIKIFLYKNLEVVIFILLACIGIAYITSKTIDNFENTDKPVGINQMDAIIYINLENRNDRKKLLLNELKKLNTDMTKVNKVTGVFIPKNGHKGCVQAHILALNLAKLNKWDMVLIMEDDAELNTSPEDFNIIVNKTLSELSNKDRKWDVIMLASANKVYKDEEPITFTIESVTNDTSNTSTKQETKDTQFQTISESTTPETSQTKQIEKTDKTIVIKKLKSATTSSAYIIKSQYYDKLLALFNECNNNMPRSNLTGENYEHYALDQQWANLQNTDNWYGLQDDIIKQRAIWSTIMKESHK